MDKIKIPFSEFSFSFARSSGAGGQNINKVNSKVHLLWNPDLTDCCSVEVIERFKKKFSRLIHQDGSVQLTSQEHRSQKANMDACIEKLHEMINSVATPPKVRRPTKPKRSAVLKRLNSKKKDSLKKQLRQKI